MKHAFSRMLLFGIQLLAYVLSTCVKIYRSVKEQSPLIEYEQTLSKDILQISFKLLRRKGGDTHDGSTS